MKKHLKSALLIVGIISVSVLLTSCADVVKVTNCVTGSPFGFWYGLWHGMIAPVSFICSLIWDDVAIYAVNNNGGWYDFGFVLGAGILSFGGGSASKRR